MKNHILQLIYKLLYHKFAWSYDFVSSFVSNGRYKSWITTVLFWVEGRNILELGHGPGHLQVTLAQLGKPGVGIDSSRQMGRQAYQRMSKGGYQPALVQAAAQNLPYPSNYFDGVLSTFPSNYILDNRTITEVMRVLRPAGDLIILPYACFYNNRAGDRLIKLIWRISGQLNESSSPLAFRWVAPYKEAGFDVETIRMPVGSSEVFLIYAQKPENV